MAEKDPKGSEPGKAIARAQLEAVIRRAADLTLSDTDAEEQLSEDEVLRIATELGLPTKHVRQAIYELPELESEPVALRGLFGPPVVVVARAVPGDADAVMRRLEDYMVTREYLQVQRRGQGKAVFAPAEDAISGLARGLTRPSSRFSLARARRVAVAARPLEAGRTHVQIATDMGEQRGSAMKTGVVLGSIGGLAVGSAAAALVDLQFGPGFAATVGSFVAFGGGLAGTLWATVAATGTRFRRRLLGARTELESLLDRAERGERLEPPPAPWRRRLQKKLIFLDPG